MSADRYLTERLPWYLSGALEEAETAEVERLLAASEDNRRELEEARAAARVYGHRLPAGVVVDYAFEGSHPEVTGELLERYFRVSPVAAEELELVRESRLALASELAGEAAGNVLPFGRPVPAAPPVGGWRRLALAASLVGVTALGLAAWQWEQLAQREDLLVRTEAQLREARSREGEVAADEAMRRRLEALESENQQLAAGKSDLVDQLAARDGRLEEMSRQIAELNEPLVNVPLIDVWPGDTVLRGEAQDGPAVVVPRQTRSVALILNSGVEKEQQITGLDILDSLGNEVWRSSGQLERDPGAQEGDPKLGNLTVALPVQQLGVGRYTLRLVNRHDGRTEILETYEIEIR